MSESLKDDAARRDAINLHDQSILVEAGAGSGKTAIMAGRIAIMLAQGIPPRLIAAVTFTELAASQLLSRVRKFVIDLSKGNIPPELRVALPDGLSQKQHDNLFAASKEFDEITCTTIHGFCQRLIKPYPAEANIDPGANVMDSNQADLTFFEIVDDCLRERLSGEQAGILAEMVLYDDRKTLRLIRTIAESLRRHRILLPPPVSPLNDLLLAFQQATENFATFMQEAEVSEPETATLAELFANTATMLSDGPDPATPSGLIHILTSRPSEEICTRAGTFKAYRKKGKWGDAAKQAGFSKSDGERLNDIADGQYSACCKAWDSLLCAAASQVLASLIEEARAILQQYQEHKRARAQIDFDDLIFAACDLLREHVDVRHALGERFAHILVDEFQDTSPLQTEIFWRLCGEPIDDDKDWTKFRIRPGSLFLVGDPKQAIYRFRDADVNAYMQARDAFNAQESDKFLSISTNFRSYPSILDFVNECFDAVLSADGQPGFTSLDPFYKNPDDKPRVAKLDIAVASENGKVSIEQKRDAEAEAVADLCARLIDSQPIKQHTGEEHLCRPGNIALLAPTGTDLWRYEEALESRGIPVATQAGKGLFRRQEIQDLIALTRVLSDSRDTLAFGALLRGPLVGLTEEELLDIIEALPRSEDKPDYIPLLNISVNPADIAHPLARKVIENLQALYQRRNSTTPHKLLSQALDVMRIRPILTRRHPRQAERALANVDLYLSLSSGYAVRGLRAFAEAMTASWTEEARAVEGRPDAQEEAVALFTIHAAKGLEWPIVIPINTMTGATASDGAVIDRKTNTFYCTILNVAPEGYKDAFQEEKSELERERIRLWYVAATRARELLVLPNLDPSSSKSAWINLVDFSLANLPNFDSSDLSPDTSAPNARTSNPQTHEDFAAETVAIAARQKRLTWHAPSRTEEATGLVLHEEDISIWTDSADNQSSVMEAEVAIQGSSDRGIILHKLMEEVLTGEIETTVETLVKRADTLIRARGCKPVSDPAKGLSAEEMANCVLQTLMIPEVESLRAKLLAEFPVYATQKTDGEEVAMRGIVDALTLTDEGRPDVVVDWKSDVAPDAQTLDHYQMQVLTYLEMTGAERGLIVLMTTGNVITVLPKRSDTA